METTLRHDVGASLLLVSGEVDVASTPELLSAMNQALQPPAPLHLDLGDVQFMDSTGLHALVSIKQCAESAGSALVIVRASRTVERLLELTGTVEYFLPAATPEP